MNYKELEKSHQKNFSKGGNAEYIELCHRIGALAYSLTGKRFEEVKTPYAICAVSKGTIVEAAVLLGFEYDGNFTFEAYESAHEFLGNFILNSK